MRTHLHDPLPEALEKGVERARGGLRKWAERGREVDEGLLVAAESVEGLGGCELIIEAAPEQLDLKRELFGRLSEVAPDAVLASNTSSIPVTSLASAAARPENVVGMHFFNPAPLMKLVEVIAADQTGPRALEPGPGGRRGDGQAGDRRRRRTRVPRQPLRPALLHGGAPPAPGARGHARADRPDLPDGWRIPHGPVRADGPRGHRHGLRGGQILHRAVIRRAALAAQPDPGADGGRGPARQEVRTRLLRLLRGALPARRPRAARARRRRRPAPRDPGRRPAGGGPAGARGRRRLRARGRRPLAHARRGSRRRRRPRRHRPLRGPSAHGQGAGRLPRHPAARRARRAHRGAAMWARRTSSRRSAS